MPDGTRSLLDVLKSYQQNSLGYQLDYVHRSLMAIDVRTGIHSQDVSNDSYTNLINCYKLFTFADVQLLTPNLHAHDDIVSGLETTINRSFGFKISKAPDNTVHFHTLDTRQELTPIYLNDKYTFVLFNKNSDELLKGSTEEPLELSLFQLLINSALSFSEMKAVLLNQLFCVRSNQLALLKVSQFATAKPNTEVNTELMNNIAWNTWQYENACKALHEQGRGLCSALKARIQQQHTDFEKSPELDVARQYIQSIEIEDFEVKQQIKQLLEETTALESSNYSKHQLAKTLYFVAAYFKKELSYDEVKAKLKTNTVAELEALHAINAYQLKYGRLQYALNKLEEKRSICVNGDLKDKLDKLITEINFLIKAKVENPNQLRVAAYNTLFLLNNEMSVEEYRRSAKIFISFGKPSNPWRAIGVLMLGISVAAIAAGIVSASISAMPIAIGAFLVGGIILLSNRERGLYKIAQTIGRTDEEDLAAPQPGR